MKHVKLATPLLAAGVLGLAALAPASAAAGEPRQDGGSYSTALNALNGSGGSGTAMIEMNGDQATVTINYSGLAETFMDGPFPHAQHIHIAGKGNCPDMSFDENGDGVVSTVEGQPAYGKIGTSLTTEGDTSADSGLAVKRFPGGPSNNYERTFTLNDATAASLMDGTGVVVVHGLDPTTLSKEAQEAKSELDPSLPLAATAPALCGALGAGMPEGAPDTGGGYLAGSADDTAWGVGAALAAAGAIGAAAYALRRRRPEEGEHAETR